jgi:hypothetical protein
MKVHIQDSIYLESDDRQFVLKQYTGKKDKKDNELFKALGYFGNLRTVISFLIRMDLMQSTITELHELLPEIKRLEDKYDRLLNI